MIVTGNAAWGLEIANNLAMKLGFTEAIVETHEHALGKFLNFKPTHMLVGEYEAFPNASQSAVFGPPLKTWEDIINAALSGQIIRRCGFCDLKEPDFIRLPFGEEDFKASFNL